MSATAEAPPMRIIGHPQPRIEGRLKVTGAAHYAADHHLPGMLYAVPVGATIAKGTIAAIDARVAEQMPGVRAVLRRGSFPALAAAKPDFASVADLEGTVYVDERRPPFDDDTVRYYGQYVALAVADTLEQAKAAADAVRVTYRAEAPEVDPALTAGEMTVKSERGDPDAAFAAAPVTVDQRYGMATETHNPIELHATIAAWEGDSLTVHEATQGVVNHRNVLAAMFGIPREKVQVISRYLGSGFGGKLFPWTHSPLAAAASRQLGRPVKLVLSRPMMFHAVGQRPAITQRIRLGAERDGRLTSLRHDYVNATSLLDDYEENCGEATPHMYATPNLRVASGLAKRSIGTPTSMRGPGAVPGLYALESAMDELAIALDMDPVALRLKNEPPLDQGLGLPFSSRHFQECLTLGAERFGWARRDRRIGSMARDGLTLGWGMAACSWLAERFPCSARVELRADGTARVAAAVQDIGTGTYTIMAQMVAEALAIPLSRVEVALGDTSLPAGPVSGGSMMSASLVAPIQAAITRAGEALVALAAGNPAAPFAGAKAGALRFAEGRVAAAEGNRQAVPFDQLLRALGQEAVSGLGRAEGTFPPKEKPTHSKHSFGAHFVEVTWQPELARLRVSRVVSVIDAGRILNPLAARNQIEGSIVMGVGMALFEETDYDPRSGAPVNASLADYVVATNADAPAMEVHFIEYPDTHLNALGARGVGEIGLAGTAAAIMNAVYHATGIRVRDLPVKLEQLLG
ncbi:xanthine dehydrogenase family protein molybdopterin-binding subunit [Siccirubricoccus sp. KC 17139]|uniref:Xanthine dehydrogenase family protein molybdopterin-binding subunit n=1 Tax=Siccirubricoccus soli TaxID=2899147 RepID=A0ABT1DC33_9PROT|nr:xanthine dehydrogenase family protein molybdopterin-binding subunit [Siccirubricoccus soli]MCO6419495.1 xanthine dehydrogenase family protein molybdopterin-binding subunit [Siccirubricoccus soli]MCP2685630.1 xanthine dehydrogenase family protein molybdopterin-binding subunit [Siccirubricoccus soli]